MCPKDTESPQSETHRRPLLRVDALLRSLALSLMDAADRLVDWAREP